MRVCVVGLWHLGTVTAACLASAGHRVVGLDLDADVVAALRTGRPQISEPGLDGLVRSGLDRGALRFTADPADAVTTAEVVWVAYDTPVDDEDRAQVSWVTARIEQIFPHLAPGALVLISSQLPVGTTRDLEDRYRCARPDGAVSFGYSPENLRLGSAIEVFTAPDRVVVGLRDDRDRARVEALLRSFCERIEWMSVESAEMTKHALNAFLATSVVFANEIAGVCERVGADAKEVERGLRSEVRIGPKAYLAPGAAFAGGTLARDVRFLTTLGAQRGLETPLLHAVLAGNERHRGWLARTLRETLGDLRDTRIAVWGLTYTPGTDTLRRSPAIELCAWASGQGAHVRAYDPAVRALPDTVDTAIQLCRSALDAARDADAIVLATAWPAFRAITAEQLGEVAPAALIIDPSRFLEASLGRASGRRYLAVGMPRRGQGAPL